MQLADFRRMVERMVEEIPPAYLEGIADIEVSPRTARDKSRRSVYTMGECIPLDVGESGAATQSRVILYYGSFRELAKERPDFDWRGEAWETVTHELRHHLEWKANADDLEDYDWAADQGFARGDDEDFDPVFFLSGERIGADVYQVDDDVFFDRQVDGLPTDATVDWQGTSYRVTVPPATMPLYLVLRGLGHPPPGDAILVFRRTPRFFDFFRKRSRPTELEAQVERA